MAVKGTEAPGSAPQAPGPRRERPKFGPRQANRAAGLRRIESNPHYRAFKELMTSSTARERQHAQIELSVVREIAVVVREVAPAGGRLLQIQPLKGPEVLLFRDQFTRPARPVIYDQADRRDPSVKAVTDFQEVDIEIAKWPAPDGHFDIVVWNRELVTVKNVMPALREVRRIIRPGGVLVLAVPNLAALHNRLLLLAGRQPTTLHINDGDHVRGFAARSMARVLERDLELRIEHVIGVGIAPLTSRFLPRPLRDLGHTVVWVLRKPVSQARPSR